LTKEQNRNKLQINKDKGAAIMDIERMIKSGFECAAFAGALGMMVFWADIVTGLTG
jgi:hypothetical protein